MPNEGAPGRRSTTPVYRDGRGRKPELGIRHNHGFRFAEPRMCRNVLRGTVAGSAEAKLVGLDVRNSEFAAATVGFDLE